MLEETQELDPLGEMHSTIHVYISVSTREACRFKLQCSMQECFGVREGGEEQRHVPPEGNGKTKICLFQLIYQSNVHVQITAVPPPVLVRPTLVYAKTSYSEADR